MTEDKTISSTSTRIGRIFSWLVTFLIPVVLILAAVRVLLSPLFIQIEYRMPGFPDDLYGFSMQDRLYWADITREYLLNDSDISFLGDLRFDDGATVYNQGELQHMVDVKNAVVTAMNVFYISLGLLIVLGVWAWRGSWIGDYRRGISRGGWLTLLLIAALLLFVLISFGVLFVAFHNVFFDPGTWRFNYSDTLIRLFPEHFWRDTFITVGLLAGGGGFVLGYFLRDKNTGST